jgi:hypothetical protein
MIRPRPLICAAALALAGCAAPPAEEEPTLPTVARAPTTTAATCEQRGEYRAEPGDPRDRDGDGIACED